MKLIKIGGILLQIGTIIYLIENFYFGWNKTPMSNLELCADNIVEAFITIALCIYCIPMMELYENAVKKLDAEKKQNTK